MLNSSTKVIIAKKAIGGTKNIISDIILVKTLLRFSTPSRTSETSLPSLFRDMPKRIATKIICKMFPFKIGLTKSAGIMSVIKFTNENSRVSAEFEAAGNVLICGTPPLKKIHAMTHEISKEIIVKVVEQPINFKPILPTPIELMPIMPFKILKKITGEMSKLSALRNIFVDG